jgi:hypothetical protein
MFKFLAILWEDERGFFGAVGNVLAASGVSDILGGDGETEETDPYASLRAQYQNYISGKLGKTTPYSYNSEFTIDQPDIEKQAEDTVSKYLTNPTTNVTDYTEATKKYSDATKASMAKTYEDEATKTKDMYNRLGLVSSTPGLTALGDVYNDQATAQNLFDSELMYKNLDRQLQAQGLDVSQLGSMLNTATGLGTTQRGSQQYSQQMSLQDLLRQQEEEQNWAQMVNSLIAGNPPQITYRAGLGEQLLNSATSALPYAAMAMI